MDYSKNLPNSLRARIIEQARLLQGKPRKHIQIQKKDQSFSQFIHRLQNQERPKQTVLRQLREQSDISLWNAVISQISHYNQDDNHGVMRTPRFTNITDIDFLAYLAQHPHSKKYLFVVHRGYLYITLRHPIQGLYIVQYLFPELQIVNNPEEFLEYKRKVIRNEGIIMKVYDINDFELPPNFPAVITV